MPIFDHFVAVRADQVSVLVTYCYSQNKLITLLLAEIKLYISEFLVHLTNTEPLICTSGIGKADTPRLIFIST